MNNIECKIFNCDKHHKNQCRFICQDYDECKHPCTNEPLHCGLAKLVRSGLKNKSERVKKI